MSRWKEASSLIISAACKSKSNVKPINTNIRDPEKYQFEILALKKKETVPSANPQICVFPGGTFSTADSIKDWESLFSDFGLNLNDLSNSLNSSNTSRLPIFRKSREVIPRWLSLRITAIRETFEESGLLLCRRNNPGHEVPSDRSNNVTNHLVIDGLESWRKKVLEDPYQFFSLCESCKCYPDVENLVLWSNWLTPSHLNERFDAVFFFTQITSFNSRNVSPDNKEISSAEWLTPSKLLEMSNNGEIYLKPPQWYEINSLQGIQTSDGLTRIINHKSRNCHLWMPVRMLAIDGEVSLLPGDDMYPEEVDPFFPTAILKKEQSISSLRCKKMHRMEHLGLRTELIDTR